MMSDGNGGGVNTARIMAKPEKVELTEVRTSKPLLHGAVEAATLRAQAAEEVCTMFARYFKQPESCRTKFRAIKRAKSFIFDVKMKIDFSNAQPVASSSCQKANFVRGYCQDVITTTDALFALKNF